MRWTKGGHLTEAAEPLSVAASTGDKRVCECSSSYTFEYHWNVGERIW